MWTYHFTRTGGNIIFYGNTWALPSIYKFAMEFAIEIAMEMNHVNLAFYQWKFSMERHGYYIVSENLGIS